MKNIKLFEGFESDVTWTVTSPITSIKNSKGVEFKVGDLARVKDYHPKYEKIEKILLGAKGNLLIYLENYEIPKNPNEIEKK